MAELVDALVSNTNGSNIVPVRPRLWVRAPSFEGAFFMDQLLMKSDIGGSIKVEII